MLLRERGVWLQTLGREPMGSAHPKGERQTNQLLQMRRRLGKEDTGKEDTLPGNFQTPLSCSESEIESVEEMEDADKILQVRKLKGRIGLAVV